MELSKYKLTVQDLLNKIESYKEGDCELFK